MPFPRPARIAAVVALLVLPVLAVAADITGIGNFHKVSDRLYRGAQPDDHAYPSLAKLGVNTVLDLRTTWEHSTENEARLVEAAGMRYINIPMNGIYKTPNAAQLASARAVLDTGGVVFVHCKAGKDRTGTVVAMYRMEREGWTNDRAYTEAKDRGIRWYHRGMRRLIRDYKPSELALKPVTPSSLPAVVLVAPDTSVASAPDTTQN